MSFPEFECEGNFGSQDPDLQPTAQDWERLSGFFRASPARKAELKAQAEAERRAQPPTLAVDYLGSQDPADQPTAEDFAAISQYIKEQKQRRLAEAAAPPAANPRQQQAAVKKAA